MAKLFVISAPSGAGKTTLVNALIEQYGALYGLEKAVTHTSRKPRSGEKEGYDYHFIEPQDFERKIAEGFFLEWITAYGAYYGMSQSILKRLEAGYSQCIILDRQGGKRIKALIPGNVLIWLETLTLEVARGRMAKRGTENKEEIEYRLSTAFLEIEEERLDPVYAYRVLSDSLESTLKTVVNIVSDELNKENAHASSLHDILEESAL